jgi:hypothetical protein
MFDWANETYFPKLSDLFNTSDIENVNWFDMFTYLWVSFLGTWFFASVVGAIGAALYIKYENAMVTVAYFIIAAALLNIVLDQVFLLILGLMTGLTIGILLYHAFIAKEE